MTTTTATDAFVRHDVERSLLCPVVCGRTDGKKHFLKIDPNLFHDPVNRAIFLKAREIMAAGKPVDMVVLSDALPPDHIGVLVEIAKDFGSTALYDQYIEILEEAKRRRDLYVFARNIEKLSGDKMYDVSDLMDRVRTFSASVKQKSVEETLQEALWAAYEDSFDTNPTKYCMSGLEPVDSRVHGFEPGTLTVIGARPSVGKSIIGMNILMHNAEMGKRALLINREMVKKNFGRRMISAMMGLDTESMRGGRLDEAGVQTMLNGITAIHQLPIDVLNWPARPSEIESAVIEKIEEGGLDLLVIDYLQRMEPDGRYKNLNEAIGSITWALKNMAMRYKIPIVLLSQLNRDAANKRPNMANLRDSGNVEQDADTIILLHEPNEENVPTRRVAAYESCLALGCAYLEIIIDKNREGATAITDGMRDGKRSKIIAIPQKEGA